MLTRSTGIFLNDALYVHYYNGHTHTDYYIRLAAVWIKFGLGLLTYSLKHIFFFFAPLWVQLRNSLRGVTGSPLLGTPGA